MTGRGIAIPCFALLLALLSCSKARHLQQAPASAPSQENNTGYLGVLQAALDANKSESGPILYKTFEAAYYSLSAQLAQEPPGVNFTAGIGTGSQVAVSLIEDGKYAVLAYYTSTQDNSSLSSDVSNLADWTAFSEIFQGSPPRVNPAALELFNQSVNGTRTWFQGLAGQGSNLTRILCTGGGGGAALAQLCGPWAQLSFPSAQVRVITFGGPRVGDEKFGYTFEQFVDLPYLWMTESDNRTVGQTPSGPLQLPYVTRVISEANYSGSGTPGSIEYYSTLLNNTFKGQSGSVPVVLQSNFSYGYKPRGQDSQYVLSLAPQGGGFFDRIRSIGGTVVDSISAAGSAISNAIGNLFGGDDDSSDSDSDLNSLTDPDGSLGTAAGDGSISEEGHNACTPILCKIQPALVQACASYNDGDSLGPGSVTINEEDTGTNVALQWTSETRTATFAFRGTDGGQDWAQNLKLRFSGDVSEGYFTELYNGSEIYSGELEAFRAVTDQSKSDDVNILERMADLSGGQEPLQVRCIGHSLGGGLATICGPWAAEVWPAADVRVVTFGSPKAGNIQFASSVYATVGRIYRVVHSNDAVPSLPPFNKYLHSNFAIYLPGDQAILDDRPPTKISDLSWDAHGCDDQYGAALENVNNVTIPAWMQQMTASA